MELPVGNVGWIWALSLCWEMTLFNYDLFSGEYNIYRGFWGTRGRTADCFCVWSWHRLRPQTALCFSFCVCKMTCEVQLGAQTNLLIAPGAATPFPASPLNTTLQTTCLLLQIWLLFSFIGLVTTGTTLGINGAMELLFKVITPYSKRHVRTVR